MWKEAEAMFCRAPRLISFAFLKKMALFDNRGTLFCSPMIMSDIADNRRKGKIEKKNKQSDETRLFLRCFARIRINVDSLMNATLFFLFLSLSIDLFFYVVL